MASSKSANFRGFLYKKGNTLHKLTADYKKRFFEYVPQKNLLGYYKSKQRNEHKGAIDLSTVTRIRLTQEPSAPQKAIDVVTPARTWVLAPIDPADYSAFLSTLCAHVNPGTIDSDFEAFIPAWHSLPKPAPATVDVDVDSADAVGDVMARAFAAYPRAFKPEDYVLKVEEARVPAAARAAVWRVRVQRGGPLLARYRAQARGAAAEDGGSQARPLPHPHRLFRLWRRLQHHDRRRVALPPQNILGALWMRAARRPARPRARVAGVQQRRGGGKQARELLLERHPPKGDLRLALPHRSDALQRPAARDQAVRCGGVRRRHRDRVRLRKRRRLRAQAAPGRRDPISVRGELAPRAYAPGRLQPARAPPRQARHVCDAQQPRQAPQRAQGTRAAQDADGRPRIKVGMDVQKGPVAVLKWKKRWFRLAESTQTLAYFAKKNAGLKGTIDLTSITAPPRTEDQYNVKYKTGKGSTGKVRSTHCFSFAVASGRTYIISCESARVRREWMVAIATVLKKRGKRQKSTSLRDELEEAMDAMESSFDDGGSALDIDAHLGSFVAASKPKRGNGKRGGGGGAGDGDGKKPSFVSILLDPKLLACFSRYAAAKNKKKHLHFFLRAERFLLSQAQTCLSGASIKRSELTQEALKAQTMLVIQASLDVLADEHLKREISVAAQRRSNAVALIARAQEQVRAELDKVFASFRSSRQSLDCSWDATRCALNSMHGIGHLKEMRASFPFLDAEFLAKCFCELSHNVDVVQHWISERAPAIDRSPLGNARSGSLSFTTREERYQDGVDVELDDVWFTFAETLQCDIYAYAEAVEQNEKIRERRDALFGGVRFAAPDRPKSGNFLARLASWRVGGGIASMRFNDDDDGDDDGDDEDEEDDEQDSEQDVEEFDEESDDDDNSASVNVARSSELSQLSLPNNDKVLQKLVRKTTDEAGPLTRRPRKRSSPSRSSTSSWS